MAESTAGKWHVNGNGEPGVCKATKGGCPFRNTDGGTGLGGEALPQGGIVGRVTKRIDVTGILLETENVCCCRQCARDGC